jgi:hypothetical protein
MIVTKPANRACKQRFSISEGRKNMKKQNFDKPWLWNTGTQKKKKELKIDRWTELE